MSDECSASLSSIVTGYLAGIEESRHHLEMLLVSDDFWVLFFDDLSQDVNCFQDEAHARLCLLLVSRRLRSVGCDENTGSVLVECLVPLSTEHAIWTLLAAVLADIVVMSPLQADTVISHILEAFESYTLLSLYFLIEIAVVVDRVTTTEVLAVNVDVEAKRAAICSLHTSVMTYCYEVIAAADGMSNAMRAGSVSCATNWLIANLLPPVALESTSFSVTSAMAGGIFPNNSLSFLEMMIFFALLPHPVSGQHCLENDDPALLESTSDLLEALFARCCEQRRCTQSMKGNLDPEWSLSKPMVHQLTRTVLYVAASIAPLFRQCLLTFPENVFGFTFLPDRHSFASSAGTGDGPLSSDVVTASTVVLTAMTRLLAGCVKLLMASSVNPFSAACIEDSSSTGILSDTNAAVELITVLVTAAGMRSTTVAAIALEACVYAHYRMSCREQCPHIYRLLMQVALRHSCSAYCSDISDSVDGFYSDWMLMREDTVGEVLRIAYNELGGEFLCFSSEILQFYLHDRTDVPVDTLVSVVIGVVFSVQACAPELSRKCLASGNDFSPESRFEGVKTTQFLIDFLWSIFGNATVIPCGSMVQPCTPLSQVFCHSDVVVTVNQLIASLAAWISDAEFIPFSGAGTSTTTSSNLVSVFDELGGECLKHLMRGFSSPCTMHSAAVALNEFCARNARHLLLSQAEDSTDETSSLRFPYLDALLQLCWVPSVRLTMQSSRSLSDCSARRQEVLSQLEVSLETVSSRCSVFTGEAASSDIQQRTLHSMGQLIAQFSSLNGSSHSNDSLTQCREYYGKALLQPLLDVLSEVSVLLTSNLPSHSHHLPFSDAAASEVTAVLELMRSLVCHGLAVASITDMLTSGSNDLKCLCDHFVGTSSSSKMHIALNLLCVSVLRVINSPTSPCHELATFLFARYAKPVGQGTVKFVGQMLDVLGARGSHLQRLKLRMGSTFGEMYEEELIEEIEKCLVAMIVDMCSVPQHLLVLISGLNFASLSEDSATRCQLQEHLCVQPSFACQLVHMLHLFQQLCATVPSLLHLLPEWISVGTFYLSVICLSLPTVEPVVAHAAASVLSQLFTLKRHLGGGSVPVSPQIASAWENGIPLLFSRCAAEWVSVLVEVLAQLLGHSSDNNEAKRGVSDRLAAVYVCLLRDVLEEIRHCGTNPQTELINTVDIKQIVMNVQRLLHQRNQVASFSQQDMHNVIEVFLVLHITPQHPRAPKNSETFANFGILVTKISWAKAPMSLLNAYNSFISTELK